MSGSSTLRTRQERKRKVPSKKYPKPVGVSTGGGTIDADFVPNETCTVPRAMFAIVDGHPLLFQNAESYGGAGNRPLIAYAKAQRQLFLQIIERLDRWIALAVRLTPPPDSGAV